MKFCLRGMLCDCQRTTLFSFLEAVRKILDEGIDQSKFQELESEINLSLALMERDFPADVQVIRNLIVCVQYSKNLNTCIPFYFIRLSLCI